MRRINIKNITKTILTKFIYFLNQDDNISWKNYKNDILN